MKQKPVLSQEELAKLAAIVTPVEPPTPEGATPPQVEAADTADFEAQLAEKDAKITELEGVVEGVKAVMAETTAGFEAKLEAQGAKLDSLKSIVAGQIKSMRVALSLADVDINAMDVDAVLSEYKATSELFVKSLPVGGLVKKEEEKPAVKAIQSSHDASKIKALGF